MKTLTQAYVEGADGKLATFGKRSYIEAPTLKNVRENLQVISFLEIWPQPVLFVSREIEEAPPEVTAVEEFDRRTAEGFYLDLFTGEYCKSPKPAKRRMK